MTPPPRPPRRSAARAARWQDRFDEIIVAAGVAAVVAVALQTAGDPAEKDAGLALSWLVWIVFALEAAVMLRVTPSPAGWARHHRFELVVVVLVFPGWQAVAHDFLATEVLPALTLLEAAKLAKLAKAVRVVRRRAPPAVAGALAALVVAAAAIVAWRVVA